MSEPAAPRGIDPAPVTAWFEANVPGFEGPLTFELITGGHSNLTYRLSDSGGHRYVLRRPPLGAVLKTAHDMAREHKILAAVGKTTVPVPGLIGLCTDEGVNGAPFYVMHYVEGVVLDRADKVESSVSVESRRGLGLETADILARLHLVDPGTVGLGDLGRREGYLDRQLKRWCIQLEKSKTRDLPDMDEAHRLLVAAKPEQRYTGIAHGDYRLGNMLSTRDGHVAAVLDWELCTLGDVLADVGYVLNGWVEPGEPLDAFVAAPPTAAPGFPTRAEWLARYCERSGFDVADVDYYQAFQHWRLAAIAEGVMARYLKGVMGDQKFDAGLYRRRVDAMAAQSLRLLRA